jgi:uncharacterized protein (DUF2237 family)
MCPSCRADAIIQWCPSLAGVQSTTGFVHCGFDQVLSAKESNEIEYPINVYGETLQHCSVDPMTGFFRDGCCNTNVHDQGSHTVCIEVTSEFLEYSRFQGNDLSTPVPEFGFPGLQPGDRWCLCAERWLEAQQQDMAPKIFLQSTHIRATDIIPLDILKQYAMDLN